MMLVHSRTQECAMRSLLILTASLLSTSAHALQAQREAAPAPSYGPVLHSQSNTSAAPDLRPLTEQEKRSGKAEPSSSQPPIRQLTVPPSTRPQPPAATPPPLPSPVPPPRMPAPPAPPAPARPVGPTTSVVNCSAGVCTEPSGATTPQGAGNASVNSEGRLCTRGAAGTIQCF